MRTHTNFSSNPLQESSFISPKTETVRENDSLLKGRYGRGAVSLWERHGQDSTVLTQAVDSKHGEGAPSHPVWGWRGSLRGEGHCWPWGGDRVQEKWEHKCCSLIMICEDKKNKLISTTLSSICTT